MSDQVIISENKLVIIYNKRNEEKFFVFLHCLHIATVTFSHVTKSWFCNMHGISFDVHESEDKKEIDLIIKKEVMKFLGEIVE